MALYLRDAPQSLAALRKALESGDAAAAAQQAHTLKGASSNVGGEALHAVVFAIEQAAKAGDLSAAQERLPELESQFVRLREALQQELERFRHEG